MWYVQCHHDANSGGKPQNLFLPTRHPTGRSETQRAAQQRKSGRKLQPRPRCAGTTLMFKGVSAFPAQQSKGTAPGCQTSGPKQERCGTGGTTERHCSQGQNTVPAGAGPKPGASPGQAQARDPQSHTTQEEPPGTTDHQSAMPITQQCRGSAKGRRHTTEPTGTPAATRRTSSDGTLPSTNPDALRAEGPNVTLTGQRWQDLHCQRGEARRPPGGKLGDTMVPARLAHTPSRQTDQQDLLSQFRSEAPVPAIIRHQEFLQLIKILSSFVNMKQLRERNKNVFISSGQATDIISLTRLKMHCTRAKLLEIRVVPVLNGFKIGGY